MNIYERYNVQKAASYNDNTDYFDEMIIKPAISLLRGFGKGIGSAIDSYIITMIETNDQRRALLDLKEIDKAKAALEKDIVQAVSADMNKLITEINNNIKQ